MSANLSAFLAPTRKGHLVLHEGVLVAEFMVPSEFREPISLVVGGLKSAHG